MIRSLVRSVIRDAHVTDSSGVALEIDGVILRAAEMLPFEEVEVMNHATGERFRTWVQPAGDGSGTVRVRTARRGDTITITAYAQLHDGQTLDHKPRQVTLDANNRVTSAA